MVGALSEGGIGAVAPTWAPEWLLDLPLLLVAILLIVGLGLGYLLGRVSRRILEAAGVPEAVEGTPFERSAQSIGTSTVSIISRMLSWFVYGVTVLGAIHLIRPTDRQYLSQTIVEFVPNLFVATLVVIVGFVVADKAELLVGERLRSVKLPEVTIVPRFVKYAVLYVAFLIALGQVGVETGALVVLLGVTFLGLVIVGAVALKDILSSATAGIYLLLRQPYGIGDEIVIGEREGVVQEMDVLVTHLESETDEYVVPNRKLFEDGVRRRRQN